VRGGWHRRELIQSLMLSPLMVPRIVTGVAIFIAAVRVGLYPTYTSMILAHVILLLPYVISILVASASQINGVQEEAAMDLGTGPLRTFWYATLPQIRSGILVAAIFGFIVSFDEFDISLMLARQDNMTLPVRMYLFMQEQENPTLSAVSTLLISVTIVVVFIAYLISRKTDLSAILTRK